MIYIPNIEAARARFVERVTNAYLQTWVAYGFMGEEYSFERAEKLAQGIAECSFPSGSPVFELTEEDIDPMWVAEQTLEGIGSIYPTPRNFTISFAGHEIPMKPVDSEGYRYERKKKLPELSAHAKGIFDKEIFGS